MAPAKNPVSKPSAVIMAGGQGERFWPLTHPRFPKYRIQFEGKLSLLQKTYRRLGKVYDRENIYVVTTREHAPMIRAELPSLKSSNLLIEPHRKNTAAAIYFSCASILKKNGPEAVVSFFPADHLIKNEALFKKTLQRAMALAKKTEKLVTIGIKPTFPATGFGYIQSGRPLAGVSGAFQVARFVEKPNYAKARQYVQKKDFYWNGGIFTWRTGVFIETMERYCPAISRVFRLEDVRGSYAKMPSLSIDYALLEKAPNIAMIDTHMDWCDLGSWGMLLEKSALDVNKNYVEGLSYHAESKNSLLINHNRTPLITLGVSGLIVVQTPRGTLICRQDRSEEAALLLKKL